MHDEPLHRGGQVVAHQYPEPVGLALKAERQPLDLLKMFQLHLEEPDELDGNPRHPGDADHARLIGAEDLLDVVHCDHVSDSGATVPRNHHSIGVSASDDGGAVRDTLRRLGPHGSEPVALGQFRE